MNLKQAARRLGIHYQSAYRLVRSGHLIAVKLGSSYEVSEAALAKFQAERLAEAALAEPLPPRTFTGDRKDELERLRHLPDAVRSNALPALLELTRSAAALLGDAAVLRLTSTDGKWLEPVAIACATIERQCMLDALLSRSLQPTSADVNGAALATDRPVYEPTVGQISVRTRIPPEYRQVLTTGQPVYEPTVDQISVRTRIPPEYRQWLDEVGLHSIVLMPIRVGGAVRGILEMSRGRPGEPYTEADKTLVAELAAIAGAAVDAAETFDAAWRARASVGERLRDLVQRDVDNEDHNDAVTHLVSDETTPIIVVDALSHRIVETSPATAAILEVKPGRSYLSIIDPHDREEHGTLLARLSIGELDYAEYRTTIRGPQNEERPATFQLTAIRTPDATLRYILCVIADTTA